MTPTLNLSNKDSLLCNLEGCQEKLMKVLYCQWLEESSCCDLQLHTSNGNIPVHTCVMMAFSPRIAEAVTIKQKKKRKGKSLEQCTIDVKFDYYTVKSIIKSIYSGVFNMTDVSDLHEFYKASNWLRVKELEDIVEALEPSICKKTGKRKYCKQKKLKNKTSSKKTCHGGVKDEAEVRRLSSLDIWEDMEADVDPTKLLAHIGSDNVDLNAVKTEVLDDEITFMDDVNSERDEGNLKCEKCKAVFTDKEEYQIHIKDHPRFTCDKCPQVYFTQAALFRHIRRSHFKSKHLRCSSCEFVASCSSQFGEHCRTVHQDMEPFRCQFNGCGYRSKVYRNLSQHVKIHDTFRPFMCEKCEKCFKSFPCLKSHRRSCYHVQKYLCDFCGQSFNHPTSMKTHRRAMHLGEKPYKCQVCGKSFSENSNYKRHMRIHDKSYPYSCPVCSQLFRHSNTLKTHMNKHGGFDNFDVAICKNNSIVENDNRSRSDIYDPKHPGINDSTSNENNDIDLSLRFNNSGVIHSSDDFNRDDICDVNKDNDGMSSKTETPQDKSLHKQSSSNTDVRPYNPALSASQLHPFIDYSIPPIQTPPPAHSLPFMSSVNNSTSSIASSFHLLFSGQMSSHSDTATSGPVISPFANQSSQPQENNPYSWYYSQYGPRF